MKGIRWRLTVHRSGVLVTSDWAAAAGKWGNLGTALDKSKRILRVLDQHIH